MTGFIEGKRVRGRQMETYLTNLNNIKEETQIEQFHMTREKCVYSEMSK